jgi:tripartite-type tricarboxylate transporter receptor subunit TctC
MKFDRRYVLQLAAGASASLLPIAKDALAQARYPDRPLRLLLPFPAGGSYDTIGRPMAQILSDILGQPVIVENKGGGEGSIASVQLARSDPDGYTILLGGGPTHVFTPISMAKPTYDPITDFQHLAVVGTAPLAIAVHPKFPARSLQELIALAKASPGKYTYGEGASSIRVGMQMFRERAGDLNMLGIPYKGAAPAINDALSGHIDVYCGIASSVARLHHDGLLRVLAVTGEKRVETLPDIPTALEAGVKDFVLISFNILSIRAGTPKAIVDRLYRAIATVLADPDYKKFLISTGLEPIPGSNPETATTFVKDQIDLLTPFIRASKAPT